MRFIALVFLAACGGDITDPTVTDGRDLDTNPDNTDGTEETVNDVLAAASLNTYEANDDFTEFTLVDTEEISADYAIDGVQTGRKTIDYIDGLSPEIHTAAYTYSANGVNYLGYGSNDVSEIADLSGNLCADLSGTWDCSSESGATVYNGVTAEINNGCALQMEGIAVGNNTATINGNFVEFTHQDGYIKLILEGTDTLTGRVVNTDAGANYRYTCTRL